MGVRAVKHRESALFPRKARMEGVFWFYVYEFLYRRGLLVDWRILIGYSLNFNTFEHPQLRFSVSNYLVHRNSVRSCILFMATNTAHGQQKSIGAKHS